MSEKKDLPFAEITLKGGGKINTDMNSGEMRVAWEKFWTGARFSKSNPRKQLKAIASAQNVGKETKHRKSGRAKTRGKIR